MIFVRNFVNRRCAVHNQEQKRGPPPPNQISRSLSVQCPSFQWAFVMVLKLKGDSIGIAILRKVSSDRQKFSAYSAPAALMLCLAGDKDLALGAEDRGVVALTADKVVLGKERGINGLGFNIAAGTDEDHLLFEH